MNNPVVSVCITAYNVGPYLAEAIEGVMMQEASFPFELIISEDCSNDNSRDVCFFYKKKYPEQIVLLLNDKNLGLHANTVQAMKHCRGKYIAWCDGDDRWIVKDKLQRQVEILEREQQVSMVHTHWIDYVDDTKKYEKSTILDSDITKGIGTGKFAVERFIKKDLGVRMSSICFRRELFEKSYREDPYLYENQDFGANDVQLFTELLIRGCFYFIREEMVVYRRRIESESITQDNMKATSFSFKCLKLNIYLIKKYELPGELVLNLIKKKSRGILSNFVIHRDKASVEDFRRLCTANHYSFSIKEKILLYAAHNVVVFYFFKLYFSLKKN